MKQESVSSSVLSNFSQNWFKSACNEKTQVWSLGWEDPLEEAMAAHSSILAWAIPGTEGPGGLQSMGSQESDMSEWWSHQFYMSIKTYFVYHDTYHIWACNSVSFSKLKVGKLSPEFNFRMFPSFQKCSSYSSIFNLYCFKNIKIEVILI